MLWGEKGKRATRAEDFRSSEWVRLGGVRGGNDNLELDRRSLEKDRRISIPCVAGGMTVERRKGEEVRRVW